MKSADHARLRVLGPASLKGSNSDAAGVSTDAVGVLSQPKRLSILAYLAVQGGFVRRDVLVAMFWPDLETDRARRALSQSIHYLRCALGREVIRTRGVEEIGITPDVIWCDVRAFEAAIAGSRWEEAADLYRGELLHGLDGGHSPEFGHWLDGVRARLRRAAGEAAATLSAAYFRNGDMEAAIHWQRRAVDIRPLDEAVLRNYLMLLDEAGNGALALREFELFRARLAAEYEVEPSCEMVKLIGMIRSRRPDPLSTAAARAGSTAGPRLAAAGVAPPAPRVVETRQRRAGWYIAPATIGAIVVLLATIMPLGSSGTTGPATEPNRVAVLHFDTMDDDSLDYVALGMTTALTTYLHGFEALDIVPNHALSRFRGWNASWDTIQAALKAKFFVSGSLSRHGSVIEVVIALSDAVTQTALTAPLTLTFTNMDGTAIIDSVMVVVAAELASELGAQLEQNRYEWGTTVDEAKDYALRAAGLADRAEEYVRDNDPGMSFSALARADSALDLAIRHDGRWAQPHILRARIAWIRAFQCFDVGCDPHAEFRQAVHHAEMAVNLDPENAEAIELRADLVWKMWIFGIEQDTAALNRAFADAENAVLLDDSRARAWSIQSAIAHERGDYRLALKRGLMALDKDEFAADRDQILDDVFDAAFNLGDDSTATRVCSDLHRPKMTLRAASCELQLRAWSAGRPADVDHAWSIVHALESATKGRYWEANRSTANLLVAAVIAAAAERNPALADSARRVIEREMALSSTGSSLLLAAAAHTRAGANDQARSLLRQHVTMNPNSIGHMSGLRWFKALDTDGTGVNLNVSSESAVLTASVFPEDPLRGK